MSRGKNSAGLSLTTWVLVLVLWGTPSPPFHSANPSIEVGLPAPCRRNVCSQIRDSRTAFQKCSSENRRFTKTGSEQTQGRSNRTQRWVTHRNRSQSKAEQWRSVLDRHPSRTHRTQTAAHRPLPSKPGSLFRSFAVSCALLVTDHSSEVSSRQTQDDIIPKKVKFLNSRSIPGFAPQLAATSEL